jgi:hypothetical protein
VVLRARISSAGYQKTQIAMKIDKIVEHLIGRPDPESFLLSEIMDRDEVIDQKNRMLIGLYIVVGILTLILVFQ